MSAGIDMALYLAKELKGEKEAKVAQLAIEYDPNPIFDYGNYLSAEPDIIKYAEKLFEQQDLKDFGLCKLLHYHEVAIEFFFEYYKKVQIWRDLI